MYKWIVVVLGLLVFPYRVLYADAVVSNAAYLKINKKAIVKAQYYPIEFGTQADISEKSVVADVGFGKVGTIFLQLPARNQVFSVELTTIVNDEKVYYPVVILLDKDFNWISVYEKGDLKLEQRGISQASSTSTIKLSPFIQYLVITTRSEFVGKPLHYEKTEAKAEMQSGSINQPDFTLDTVKHSARYSATPQLEILLPEKHQTQAIRHQNGLLIEFGYAFGNESITLDSNGNDYKVGSGTLYGFGYALESNRWRNLIYRFSAGQRQQSGHQDSSAVYAQSLVLKEFSKVNFGAGLYADINHSLMAQDNRKIEFDNALGFQLVAEWRIYSHLNLSGKYVFIRYDDDTGRTFNGNQILILMQFFN